MKELLAPYWRRVASGKQGGLLAGIVRTLLVPPSLVYALLQRLRATMYRAGWMGTVHLPRPVVSIGNLTAGGTGKTPLTAYIAESLLSRGVRVAVLSRGYGGSCEGQTRIVSDGRDIFLAPEECGDEPFQLASTIPGLMVVIGTDRHEAGLLALQSLNPDLFLLDDGFQHLRLHRDLDILLLDCAHPFGNGWTLPAGLLREPAAAAGRAGLIIHTRCPPGASPAAIVPGKQACAASHRLIDLRPLAGGEAVPFSALKGSKCLAFAGIAQPEEFFAGLRDQGLDVVQTRLFSDHAGYGQARVEAIRAVMKECGAEYAVTTEKDGVKLKMLPQDMTAVTYVARMTVELTDPGGLHACLSNLLQTR